ncbi:MAG: guanine nucleotide-binding protein subunit alpha [Trichoglossum hirsutum]|nr:MAG: guanine nucleotide-binding protein subunit alpha [Trichoglossum hirsutum]
MNVGFSIFDFVAVPAYAWRVYRACRSSSEEFKSVAAEVASLHVVLKETEEYVSERGASLGSDREAQLMVLEKECRGVLQDLETLLLRYESLGTQTQRTWDRMRWGSEDISAARQRLSTCTTLLTSFNLNLVNSSLARIETKLDKLVAEVRAGGRNSSVISSRTVESLSKHDQTAWHDLRKELQDMGIPVAALNEHRQFITNWLKEAIESGALEEERPKEWEGEASSSVMTEQKTIPWTTLSRAVTSPTLVSEDDMTRPVREKSLGRIMEQQSPRSNKTNDRPTLHARVNTILSKLPLLDIQLRKDKERARNEEIEKQLGRERSTQRNNIKILLLDDNEPGNSKLLKQLRLQHSGGFTPDEQESFKSIILSNILQSMKAIIKELEQTGVSLDGTSLEPYSRAIQLLQPHGDPNERAPPAARTAIRMLWGDSQLQPILKRSDEYQHNRATRYYLNSIDRITAPVYCPTDKDILHARAKTIGVTEQTFDMNFVNYRIFDAVYPEKRPLIQYFEEVSAIIFSVDLAESDRVVDQSTNKCLLQEDIEQFDAVCNSRYFCKTPVMLYLNNTDCFYDKLNVPPLSNQFLNYQGGPDNLAALDYIRDLFQQLNHSSDRSLNVHLSSSMDTSQLRTIEKFVNNVIIQTNVDRILQSR